MNLARVSLYTTLTIIGLIFLGGVQSSFAWTGFARTNQLFAVGQTGSEWSYLYEINPLTGDLRLIGDTGLNNCTGLDFTPEGKLKAFCELREDGELGNRNGASATPGITAELDVDSGFPEWAVPHGVSSNISDISINEQGVLFSYENVDPESLYKHLEDNDFMAELVGETGIEAEDHAIAIWRDGELNMAANTGVPALYAIDTESGVTTKMAELSFPSLEVLSVSSSQTRAIAAEDIQMASMDSVEFDVRALEALNTRAGIYAFDETEADFVVLMTKQEDLEADLNQRYAISRVWSAVALLDADTNQIDYTVEMEGIVDIMAIAVRSIEPRPIPTMSEWGLILTASCLFVLAVIMLHRRNKSVSA